MNLGFVSGATPGSAFSVGTDISGDGLVVFGISSYVPDRITPFQAFRWTEFDGMVGLGFLGALPNGLRESRALAGSGDGTTAVGMSTTSSTEEAFRWTLSGGMEGLGVLPGYVISSAQCVSGDGSVIAGIAYTGNFGSQQAVRWTPSGMSALGFLPEATESAALSISEDGAVIAGATHSETNSKYIPNQGFRWTESEGMTGLGLLSGGTFSVGYGASGNGSVIIGAADNNKGESQAVIWDAVHGLRNLKSVLETDYGLDLGSVRLRVAQSISPDGTIIAGDGDDGAWIATIPEPGIGLSGVVGLGPVLWLARRRCEPSQKCPR
jgi:uncharacterized membrane protein